MEGPRGEKSPKDGNGPRTGTVEEDEAAARIEGREKLIKAPREDRLLTTILVVVVVTGSLLLDVLLLEPPAVPEGLLLRAT